MKYIVQMHDKVEEMTKPTQGISSLQTGYLGENGSIVDNIEDAKKFNTESSAQFDVDMYGYRNATVKEVD